MRGYDNYFGGRCGVETCQTVLGAIKMAALMSRGSESKESGFPYYSGPILCTILLHDTRFKIKSLKFNITAG